MENRIDQLFKQKNRNILSVYFTAGYPRLGDTLSIIEILEQNGVDMIEIGIPFSDPTADGPTIQKSNHQALLNGMSLDVLFDQLKDVRKNVKIPLIMMGYINPVIRFGAERFCKKCRDTGIDGVILPDLPPDEFRANYASLFKEYGIHNILLITPQTGSDRIHEIDRLSEGFIYMVSSSSTTGEGKKVEDFRTDYFTRVNNMELKNPRLIGFGISDKATFENACRYASGAIIGSAFVKALTRENPLRESISGFISAVRASS
jgi:tryptophan synthase alpha chain